MGPATPMCSSQSCAVLFFVSYLNQQIACCLKRSQTVCCFGLICWVFEPFKTRPLSATMFVLFFLWLFGMFANNVFFFVFFSLCLSGAGETQTPFGVWGSPCVSSSWSRTASSTRTSATPRPCPPHLFLLFSSSSFAGLGLGLFGQSLFGGVFLLYAFIMHMQFWSLMFVPPKGKCCPFFPFLFFVFGSASLAFFCSFSLLWVDVWNNLSGANFVFGCRWWSCVFRWYFA